MPAEALVRPAASLLIAAAVPFLSARLLAWAYLSQLPAGGDERARRLAPFRRGAFIAGIGQLQLAWMLGATALGPELVASRSSLAAIAFGLLCATVAFCAGGVARRIEEPEDARATALGTIALRLRLVPFFVGPVIVAALATRLPLTEGARVAWGWVAVAAICVVLGVAYGGLFLSLLTRAVVPARDEVRALAREVAAREGVAPVLALRLPTPGTRFANAAALPWARTLIVTDHAASILDRDALHAVLAHEAGHLSEGPKVMLARLGAGSALLFVAIVGPDVALTLPGHAGWAVLAAGLLAAILGLLAVRRIARRMEQRADARAAETAGADHLARALRALHANGQMPMVTGRRRVHPDLYDRLIALGEEPGPRPPPPPRGGLLLGLAWALSILALPIAVHSFTDVQTSAIREAPERAARWRRVIDPWDPDAMLALAWRARAGGELDVAFERAELAARMGPDRQSYYLAWSELHAAAGDCDAARDAFEESLTAQATEAFDAPTPLELGGYDLPPTLVTDCDLTVGDAFGGDATLRTPLP